MSARTVDEETIRRWISENTSPSPGSSYLVAEYTLNNDEILALRTTPVNVVPGQGEGTIIIPFLAYIVTNFAGGNYGNGASASFQLAINENGALTDVSAPIIMDSALNSTNPAIRMFSIPYTYATDLDPFFSTNLSYNPGGSNGTHNMPLAIADIITSGSGNYTGGHANNTVKVVVHYIVVNLP